MFKLGKDCEKDVQTIYSGVEGQLWELLMGEQIHIGGLVSSEALARFGRIAAGSRGVDFCCCSGAGMRFLLKRQAVAFMAGVDFTSEQVKLGAQRMKAQGVPTSAYRFYQGNAAEPCVKAEAFDFVWGEDAWCYVADKSGLLAQAKRALKPGGKVVFSDWVATEAMSATDAKRFLSFMKFSTFMTVRDYQKALAKEGFNTIKTKVTSYFVPSVKLYAAMYTRQHAYDVLRLLGFNQDVYNAVLDELTFILQLAQEKKLVQAYFVATK